MKRQRKYPGFRWSSPSVAVADKYFESHQVWHVAFGTRLNPLSVCLSSKMLHSNISAAALYEDEGGVLSAEPDDQQEKLFIEAIQSIIPDGMLVSCRTFEDYKGFFGRPVFNYTHLGEDKARLAQVFTRFGIDPDSIADYIFVSPDPAAHEPDAIRAAAAKLDDFENGKIPSGDRINFLVEMTTIYDPLIWALDSFLFVTTLRQTRDEIKNKIAPVAAKYNLELPPYDYNMHYW